MSRRIVISPIVCFFAGILSVSVGATEQNPASTPVDTEDDSTIIYPASFFQPYNPVSVNDMIDRIPGVSIGGGGGGGRGLGSGGDLLINGQRLAGKDNSPRDQLSRIAAREVERIEIIRGTSGELAVRGSGQVVNIVLQDTAARASTSVEVSSDRHMDGTIQPGASISHSRQIGNLSMMFNIMADSQYRQDIRHETSYTADLTATEVMRETNVRDRMRYGTSTTLGYQLEQHRMQLNALYGTSDHPSDIRREYSGPGSNATLQRAEREKVEYEQHNWEIGGDYEYSFAGGSRAMLLFIANDGSNNYARDRFDIADPLDDSTESKSLFIGSDSRTRERIVQSTFSWGLTEQQDMQLGMERAQTILDSALRIGRTSGTTEPSDEFGGLRPALSVSNPGSTVEEMRYEGFAVHNLTLNDRMTLESSLVYETSEISQTGSTNLARDFSFWKPSVDYRFNITDALQLRATVGKEVQQLSFANFSATANTSDNDRDADAGNPQLVPTQEVRYELKLEYRLPDDTGVLSSRFFLRELTDYIGRINATTNPTSPISASGNIGDAKRWGVYLDGSTRLNALGMPDALISSSLYLFDSEVTDAILGTRERINGRGRFNLGFRHDITDLNLNYGFDYGHPFNGGQRQIEISSIDSYRSAPSLTMFVSTVLFDDVTFRLESNNTLSEESCRDRVRYNGLTSGGQIRELENSCWGSGRKVALKVRTTF